MDPHDEGVRRLAQQSDYSTEEIADAWDAMEEAAIYADADKLGFLRHCAEDPRGRLNPRDEAQRRRALG
ncbi:MAG TPA: hypothetical protein VHB98_03925 [Chloroflexota bacterium]|nr:hypothetical protein [Chloroflexota bacterium]